MTNGQKPIIATGIGEHVHRLGESSQLPSVELVYLADKWLGRSNVTSVYTGMDLGWEQAIAKAAFRRNIPFTAVVPAKGMPLGWMLEAEEYYRKLVRFSERVEVIPPSPATEDGLANHTRWMIDQSSLLLVLWEYDFCGPTYAAVDYAIKKGINVINLWEEWHPLRSMRRKHVVG